VQVAGVFFNLTLPLNPAAPSLFIYKLSDMSLILHKAHSRGHANHGWLNSHHSFSFASYHNPERVHFGVLRVLNDDWIAGGEGFGKHPHDNMEIITIPLAGALEHQDSMGNKEVLHAGEVQAMSAGTGIHHSEYNAKADEPCTLLQIWIFPEKRNVTPQYAQKYYDVEAVQREWHAVVNPVGKGEGLEIHQQAWFSLSRIPAGTKRDYDVKRAENGVYFFVIEGAIKLDDQPLEARDAAGVMGSSRYAIEANEDAFVLAMDIPLQLPQMG
jgi:quercetin 2,3-dioxygenase